jgi:signal transduction histidine kinase
MASAVHAGTFVLEPASKPVEESRFSGKLAAGFVLIVLTLSVATGVNLRRFATLSERVESSTAKRLEGLLLAERTRAAMDQSVAASRGYLLAGDADLFRRMRRAQSTVDEVLDQLAGRMRSTTGVGLIRQLREVNSSYKTVLSALVTRKTQGAGSQAVTDGFEQDLVPSQRQLDRLLDQLVEREERRFQAAQQGLVRERSSALRGAVVTLAIGVLLSCLLAVFLGRHLARLYRRERAAVGDARRATQSREELLAVVAHDLRSPLGAIGLRAAALAKASSEAGTRHQAESIAANVSRMKDLLSSLLDAARVDSGQLTLNKAPCDVQSLLAEVLAVHGELAEARQIELDSHVSRVPFSLYGDRPRILQVLHNLVSNAVRFSPSGGRVRIIAQRESAVIHFAVSDSGRGVPAEHLSHVFDRYWRSDSPGDSGIGLGLYIARNIVEAHGGRIWAENDGGAVFHFTLPASAAAGPMIPSSAGPAASSSTPTRLPVSARPSAGPSM